MKQILYRSVIAAAAAVIAAAGCTAEREDSSAPQGGKYVLSVAGSYEGTKVSIGSLTDGKYPVTWSESGETASLIELVDGELGNSVTASDPALSSENKVATFSFEMEAKEGASYDYYLYSPSSAVTSSSATSTVISFPTEQTPLSSSIQADAAVLSGSLTGQTAQASGTVDASFSHLAAYGKVTFKNIGLADGETLNSIYISAPDKEVAGTYNYSLGSLVSSSAESSKDEIKVYTSNLTVSDDGFDVWFSCHPFSLAVGDQLNFAVRTDQTVYTRNITLASAIEFKNGQVSGLTVDLGNKVQLSVTTSNYSQPNLLTFNTNSSRSGSLGYLSTNNIGQASGNTLTFTGFAEVDKIVPHTYLTATGTNNVYKWNIIGFDTLSSEYEDTAPQGVRLYYNPDTKLLTFAPSRLTSSIDLNNTASGNLNVLYHVGNDSYAHEHYEVCSFPTFKNNLSYWTGGILEPANGIPMARTATGVFEDYFYVLPDGDNYTMRFATYYNMYPNVDGQRLDMEDYSVTSTGSAWKFASSNTALQPLNNNGSTVAGKTWHMVIDTNEKTITLTEVTE